MPSCQNFFELFIWKWRYLLHSEVFLMFIFLSLRVIFCARKGNLLWLEDDLTAQMKFTVWPMPPS